ncbi:hypothetical protein ACF8QE_25480 [Pseudomonas sp. GLN_3]|uniref:hypothetical protein n=1 Tax=Pseudomonas sp. GLN_3 TaxID=3367181 RepID=UPI00370C3A8B
MSLRIMPLLQKLTDCGPEARFILETISRAGAWGGDKPFRSSLLAKQLHLATGVISAALRELVAVGVLERLESSPGGKGRPTISYQIAPGSLVMLEEEQSPSAFHAEHLKRLFSGADIPAALMVTQPKPQKERTAVTKLGRPAPPGARNRLSICNRMLLGALLASADQFGIVSGLSNLDLRRLTGLDPESLSHRLKRLAGVGLIRSHVPGVSSSVFSNGKVNSSYFLNLNHPGFGIGRSCAVIVHLARDAQAKRIDHAEILRRDTLAGSRSSDKKIFDTPAAVIRFLAWQKPEVFDVLQLRLLQYASELLTRHWLDLGAQRNVDADWLRDKVACDLRKPPIRDEDQGKADREWQVVIRHFCGLVFEIARDYRSRFGQADWIGYDSGGLSILPVLQGNGYWIITLLLQPPPIDVSECTVLVEERRGVVSLESWRSESDMPLIRRIQCGLATRPARRLARG